MKQGTTHNFKYLGGALGIHALLAALLFGAALLPRKPIQPSLSLKAVMVDRATLAQLAKQAEPAAEPVSEPVTNPVPQTKPPEPDPAELQRKQQEAAEQKKQQLREQQLKEQAEREKQIVLQKQAEADKQKQLEAQRKAQAEQKRQQQEAEQKRVAEIQQKQREAEQKRQAEADARAQKAREAELAAQLAAEEGRASAVNAGLLNQYVAMIQQKVMRNWIKPPTAKAGLECEVKVTQATGGTVLSVSVGRCNGDQAVRTSIEAAVSASSPLPAPPDARLFDRNLAFIFKPLE